MAEQDEAPAEALLLTYDQAARSLQVSVETIRRLVRSGELAVVDFGHKNRRIERAELARFIARRRVRQPDTTNAPEGASASQAPPPREGTETG